MTLRRTGFAILAAVLPLAGTAAPAWAQGTFVSEPGWVTSPPESLSLLRPALPAPSLGVVAYVHDLKSDFDDWAGVRVVRTQDTSRRTRLTLGGTLESRRDQGGGLLELGLLNHLGRNVSASAGVALGFGESHFVKSRQLLEVAYWVHGYTHLGLTGGAAHVDYGRDSDFEVALGWTWATSRVRIDYRWIRFLPRETGSPEHGAQMARIRTVDFRHVDVELRLQAGSDGIRRLTRGPGGTDLLTKGWGVSLEYTLWTERDVRGLRFGIELGEREGYFQRRGFWVGSILPL